MEVKNWGKIGKGLSVHQQNLINWFTPTPSKKFHQNLFITGDIGDILLTRNDYTHTDHTDAQTDRHTHTST